MSRFVCIHGHFYQPPRENPWLDYVQTQPSARPYHDWNARITAECYQPNATSRILDEKGRIAAISNNYSRISFDFGPTLLSWLERYAPDTYQSILNADRESMQRFSGHGSAMAQAYNHVIMPLAPREDKDIQVAWAIEDFRKRFGRNPEGMWLPETAVDTETLEVLAERGIAFTILAPHQAARVRRTDEQAWQDAHQSGVDPRVAYRCPLPSGRSISLFFYSGAISHELAFGRLLDSGEDFANRLLDGFNPENDHGQLVHVATDGETYGHHHPHGDMALAYALQRVQESGAALLTNYAAFLAAHPPEYEVQILENSSWSCAHGVERWRSDCGCCTGAHRDWNQRWRSPLREALDQLRKDALSASSQLASGLFSDTRRAVEDYISVILDRSAESVSAFLEANCTPTGKSNAVEPLRYMELRRHLQLMYTSCGWFFDDLSDIGAVQIMRYAARAMQLVRDMAGKDLEESFLTNLENAASNLQEAGSGRDIYESLVHPTIVNVSRLGAHYAIDSLFEKPAKKSQIYSYDAERDLLETARAGKVKLAVGRVQLFSRLTRERTILGFGALHLSDQVLHCGVRPFSSEEQYRGMRDEAMGAFHSADFAEVLRVLDRQFGETTYSLKDLFGGVQRRIIHNLFEAILRDIENAYRRIYTEHAAMMRYLPHIGVELPDSFKRAAEYVINLDLERLFQHGPPDLGRLRTLLGEVEALHVHLDEPRLEYGLRGTLEEAMEALRDAPGEISHLEAVHGWLDVVDLLPFRVKLWNVQNLYHFMRRAGAIAAEAPQDQGGSDKAALAAAYDALGKRLNFSPR